MKHLGVGSIIIMAGTIHPEQDCIMLLHRLWFVTCVAACSVACNTKTLGPVQESPPAVAGVVNGVDQFPLGAGVHLFIQVPRHLSTLGVLPQLYGEI